MTTTAENPVNDFVRTTIKQSAQKPAILVYTQSMGNVQQETVTVSLRFIYSSIWIESFFRKVYTNKIILHLPLHCPQPTGVLIK